VPIAADYPFLDVFWTMILFFLWVAWIYTLVVVLGDVFQRHDLSGSAKAAWTLLLIFVPFLAVLTYLILRGKQMGGSLGGRGRPASEIDAAKQLLDSGAITQAEFDGLKRKALA